MGAKGAVRVLGRAVQDEAPFFQLPWETQARATDNQEPQPDPSAWPKATATHKCQALPSLSPHPPPPAGPCSPTPSS